MKEHAMKTPRGMPLMLLSLVYIGFTTGWAQTPVKGGTFIYGRGADSLGLDPAVVTDGESFRVTRNIYESLLEYARDSTASVPRPSVVPKCTAV
jgi:peptide/nickel transport system substrate-binding protein